MKLTINREVLLNNLNVLSNGLASRTPLPSMTGILINAVEGGVVMTSSKSDIAIRTTVISDTLTVEEEGSVLVNGKFFIDIMRKVKSEKVSLSTEGNTFVLNADRGRYTLTIMDVNEYPNIDFNVSDTPIELDAKMFTDLIKTTSFSASQSEKKPILTGVHFKFDEGNLVAVATDSFRLSQNSYTIPNTSFEPITVPSKNLTDLAKCIGEYDGMLSISFSKTKMIITFDNIEFSSRLLDGNYPDTKRLIVNNFYLTLRLNRNELLEVVDRVALMTPSDNQKDREITYSAIKMDINGKNVVISSKSTSLGDASEEITALNENENSLSISFSAKYFIEALKNMRGEEVLVNFTDTLKPFICTEVNNTNVIQLILPLKQ